MKKNSTCPRRKFLQQGALGFLGAGAAAGSTWSRPLSKPPNREKINRPDASPQIREYRTLGRTGFKVSDLSAGSITDEGVLGTALDAGMNYIDTAEEYPGHHKVVAKVMKNRPRKSVFVTTKLEVKDDKSKQGFLDRARMCLRELDLDYVDCIMMHMAETTGTLKTEGFHQAMQELKTEGRLRFTGVSNHGSFWHQEPKESMDTVLLAAVEDGRFDVFLMAYNFLKMDRSEHVLRAANEKDIGTVLMKTTPVAIYYSLKSRIEKMEEKGQEVHPLYKSGIKRYKDKLDKAETFIKKYHLQNPEEIKAAAVRFVLDNPDVSTVSCLARTFDELDGFLRLSGSRLSEWEKTKLAAYAEGCGELYCRHACGECETECPQGVPVNTILRYHHYLAQGREQDAIRKYAAIPGVNAEACRECPGHCERACPYGVAAQGLLLLAHEQLAVISAPKPSSG
ncbi:MAG: aldo/keto reductase [Candidatus Aminicenantes bacterium]